MRVLLIPEQFPSDQNPVAGIFMRDQIAALSRFARVTVFNSNPWYRGKYQTTEGVRQFDFHLYESKPPALLALPAYAWWQAQSFRAGLRIPRPDVVHLHGAALRGPWAVKLARHWGVPLVVTEHTGPWSAIADRRMVLRRAKKTLESADMVLPVSCHLADEIAASGIRPKKTQVLGNPVDTDFFLLRPTALTHPRTILFLGRLDGFKGGLKTLKAFERVQERLRGFRMRIVGKGPEAGVVRAHIAESKMEDRVVFEERTLSREEMLTAFHEACFLVFPSQFESFGLVAAEALATGLPTVLTNRTGPMDFSQGPGIELVDPDSTDDIAAGMCRMAEKLDRIDPVAVREYVVRKFGIGTYSERLEEVYRSTGV